MSEILYYKIILHNIMKTRKKMKLENTVEKMLEMLMYIKIYHWKTSSYATHKATDKLYALLNEHMDKFVEIYLGKQSKDVPLVANFSAKFLNEKKFISKTKSFIRHLEGLHMDEDLISVRDDLVGDLNQFLYLLSFK
ncbi:hypothetical protein 162286324 [Organic Lake phycodnavirus]|nr:hypothetical protein 162286324 [Organic Lake phycodnavirus]